MDHRVVTSPGVVHISRLTSRLRRSAREGTLITGKPQRVPEGTRLPYSKNFTTRPSSRVVIMFTFFVGIIKKSEKWNGHFHDKKKRGKKLFRGMVQLSEKIGGGLVKKIYWWYSIHLLHPHPRHPNPNVKIFTMDIMGGSYNGLVFAPLSLIVK